MAESTEPQNLVHPAEITQADTLRLLFWENVVREMLTGLSMMRESTPDLFDGRIAILTHGGERIPIAEVSPMFACGIPGSPRERAVSMAVECSVFQIRTPGGEVFTLPLSQVRGMHALSPELMKQLEKEAAEQAGEGDPGEVHPFGLAAFRSITRASTPSPPPPDTGAI